MFKSVTIIGSIQDASGKPLANRTDLLLEVNFIEDGWRSISKAVTDDRGTLEGGNAVRGFDDLVVAPQFRLRAERDNEPLATSYQVKMQGNSQLQIDFGMISPSGSGDNVETQKLKERLASLSLKNTSLEAEVTAADARFEQSQRDCEQRLTDKNKTIDELRGELNARKDAVSAVASQEIARLKTDLVGTQVELARVSAEKDIKTADHVAALQERDVFKNDLDLIRTSDTASPLITDLAGSVAKSLGDAGKTTDGASGFAVADAKVTLKGYLADGGQRFKPLDAAELSRTNAHAASEISFSLKPTTTQAEISQQMPDVVGLTPASARRILRPLGNQIQLIEAEGKPAGGIVAQTPRAGQDLPDGTLIRLTVATGPAEEG